MMDKQRSIADRAIAMVGLGYIYGATGWECTQARIEAQCKQYPQYADQIRKYGPKWIGKPCYDCAQYTRSAAQAVGIFLPSGATSQYKSGLHSELGRIETIPRDEVVQLWREDPKKPGVMAHTGIYLGDGTFGEARGHSYGCVRRMLSAGTWTHWGRFRNAPGGVPASDDAFVDIPQDAQVPDDYISPPPKALARQLRVTIPKMRGDDVLLVQQLLLARDIRCLPVYGPDAVYGKETRDAVIAAQKHFFPQEPTEWDGIVGARTWSKMLDPGVMTRAEMV